MKTLYVMGIAALLFGSCSEEEKPIADGGSDTIEFVVSHSGTRVAESIDMGDDVGSFKLWAVQSNTTLPGLDGVEVSYDEETDKWNYGSTSVEWPNEDEIEFYAYAPFDAANVDATGVTATKTVTYTVPAPAQQEDFLIATAKAAKADGDVELMFNHALARVEVVAIADGGAKTITAIKLLNLKNKGVFDLANNTWTPDDDVTDYTAKLNDADGQNDGVQVSGTGYVDVVTGDKGLMVLPQETELGGFDATGEAIANDKKDAFYVVAIIDGVDRYYKIADADNPDKGIIFEAGRKYILRLDLSPVLKEFSVKMGAAVSVSLLRDDAQYRKILTREFNSVTVEDAMKMNFLQKEKGTWTWEDADYIVDFAVANNMRVHGHTLIWFRAEERVPWLNAFEGTKEEWKNLMKDYIQTVVTHFKDKVDSWDVVNEAFEDDGTYRPCLWLDHIGEEYIELAFQYAHEADPDALLFYNDFGQEYSTVKSEAINNMAKDLHIKGVPIHGIGLQMHVHTGTETKPGTHGESQIKRAIREASATGLLVHVSELDVSVNYLGMEGFNPTLTFTPELAEKQKDSYRYATEGVVEVPENQRYGLTTWGIIDPDPYPEPSEFARGYPDWPLPFTGQYAEPFTGVYEKKPAYYGILEGLR